MSSIKIPCHSCRNKSFARVKWVSHLEQKGNIPFHSCGLLSAGICPSQFKITSFIFLLLPICLFILFICIFIWLFACIIVCWYVCWTVCLFLSLSNRKVFSPVVCNFKICCFLFLCLFFFLLFGFLIFFLILFFSCLFLCCIYVTNRGSSSVHLAHWK